MRQLLYQVCYARYWISFYLWWIGSVLKYCKIPKYYDQNCRCMKYSCMYLMSVTWKLFRSSGLWDNFKLDSILAKGDQLFIFITKFRYLGLEDFPQELLVETSSINAELLESRTGEISWDILNIICRNCKWCSVNWNWCSIYC